MDSSTNPLLNTPVGLEIVQFHVPRLAAAALHPLVIRDVAKAAGALETRYETSTVRVTPGTARITCRRMLVPFLIDDWTSSAATARDDTLIAIAEAIAIALEAIKPKPSGPAAPAFGQNSRGG